MSVTLTDDEAEAVVCWIRSLQADYSRMSTLCAWYELQLRTVAPKECDSDLPRTKNGRRPNMRPRVQLERYLPETGGERCEDCDSHAARQTSRGHLCTRCWSDDDEARTRHAA